MFAHTKETREKRQQHPQLQKQSSRQRPSAENGHRTCGRTAAGDACRRGKAGQGGHHPSNLWASAGRGCNRWVESVAIANEALRSARSPVRSQCLVTERSQAAESTGLSDAPQKRTSRLSTILGRPTREIQSERRS